MVRTQDSRHLFLCEKSLRLVSETRYFLSAILFSFYVAFQHQIRYCFVKNKKSTLLRKKMRSRVQTLLT